MPVVAPVSAWRRLKRLFGGESGSDPVVRAGAADRAPTTSSADPTRRALPQVGDYAVEQLVARNDRATLYRATERATGRVVALKTVRLGRSSGIDPGELRERFLREAAAAARLAHDNIVRVHAGGVTGEGDAVTGWLAMEWVAGADLSRYATPSRLLPEGVVLAIAARVALALAAAHDAGIVHRDIKPSNVLFDPASGAVKVADFGSARLADASTTRSGLIIGTPAYMAPELLAGAPATPQCDLYALGVMLFELLVGRRPFEGDSMGVLLSNIAHQPPPPLRGLRPELPALLDHIVGRLLSKSPAMRQPDGRQVALELHVAQTRCAPARPGSAAAAWADTSRGAPGGVDPLKDAAGNASFRGTIDEQLAR